MALTKVTEKIISDNLSISGIASASNFKTGTTNVHNVGVEAAGINVLGADTPIGTGATIYNDGGARFSGIVSATSFVGSGANLTGVASTDNIKTSTTANFTGGIQVGGATTLTGALSVSGNLGVGGVLTYEDVANVDSVGVITARQGVRVNVDGSTSANYISVGAGSDLKIYHDGNNSILNDSGTGSIITQSDSWIYWKNAAGTETIIKGGANAQVELYYDNSKKLETTNTGTTITGNLNCTALLPTGNLELVDSNAGNVGRIRMGAGDDFVLYHDGSHSHLANNTGELRVAGDIVKLMNGGESETYLYAVNNGAVELNYDNTKKFETTSTGATVTSHLLASGTGGVTLRAGSTNAGGAALYLDGDSDGDCSGSTFAYITHDTSGHLNIMSRNPAGNAHIIFGTNDYNAFRVDENRHIRPESDNARDLVTSSYRWRNLYTTDLQLSNKGSQNDVDGTWGNYTIQEGESDLFLINNRNGKKYKFNLTEVS